MTAATFEGTVYILLACAILVAEMVIWRSMRKVLPYVPASRWSRTDVVMSLCSITGMELALVCYGILTWRDGREPKLPVAANAPFIDLALGFLPPVLFFGAIILALAWTAMSRFRDRRNRLREGR